MAYLINTLLQETGFEFVVNSIMWQEIGDWRNYIKINIRKEPVGRENPGTIPYLASYNKQSNCLSHGSRIRLLLQFKSKLKQTLILTSSKPRFPENDRSHVLQGLKYCPSGPNRSKHISRGISCL